MFVYGIRGNAFKPLKSYLTGRTQYVNHDGVKSTCNTLPIQCGVPQDSILGPWLMPLANQYLLLVLYNVQA